MPHPTFIVAGVAKAGSTSMFEYLRQHPEVFVIPRKAANYFILDDEPASFTGPGDASMPNRKAVHDWDEYQALFDPPADEIATGEVAPRYMEAAEAPARIHARLPATRIVVALRHPVDRAYSTWMWNRLSGRERLPFDEAIRESTARQEAGWSFGRYLEASRYADQLSRYFDLFGRSGVHVHLYEDFAADPAGVMRDIYDFIGVDPSFEPDTSRRFYSSGLMGGRAQRAWDATHRLRARVRPLLGYRVRRAAFRLATRSARRPELDPVLRSRLVGEFCDDVMATQQLLGRDLSPWLE